MTDDWNAQVRRGLLELCVLSILDRETTHGYRIVTRLAACEPLAANEGTVYPILRRLRKRSLLDATWEESPAGPPRQVYRLTRSGRLRLDALRQQWRDLSLAVDQLVDDREAREAAT